METDSMKFLRMKCTGFTSVAFLVLEMTIGASLSKMSSETDFSNS